MSYLVLALKWRPQRFSDVVGQEPVSRTLSNALKTGRTAHAYLFSGPRGVGKTTMARILAKALNCQRGPADEPCNECAPCLEITGGRAMDVIEIDGASNRGIDDIRELRESAQYAPSSLERKVYIIDEVHMLTTDAFNALLKTLEEPPRHVVFIFATTEPLKVPATILSRCQRFDFARLGASAAFGRLRQICDSEGIAAEDEALHLVARKGEGSMRDALTLLDQVLATGESPLTAAGVRTALGITGYELFFEWAEAIRERDTARVLRSFNRAIDAGASLQELAEEFLQHLRNLLVVATDPELVELLEVTDEERAAYLSQAAGLASADLLRYCRLCLETAGAMRRSAVPRVHLEVALAEMCSLPTALDLRRFIDVTRGRFPEPESAGMPAPPPRGADAPRSAAGMVADRPVAAAGALAAAEPSSPRPREEIPAEGVRPAPRAESAPAAPAAGSSDSWGGILAVISSQKPALAAFLAGSFVLSDEGKLLHVGVPGLSAFNKEQLERKANKQFLVELIEKSFGRPLGVRFEAAAAGGAPAAAGSANAGSVSAGASTLAGAGPRAALGTLPAAGAGGSTGAPGAENALPGGSNGNSSPGSNPSGENTRREASPERIQKIADLFGGDVIGPA